MDDTHSPRHTTSSAADGSAPAAGGATLGDYVLGDRLDRRPAADVYAARHAVTRAPRLVYVLRPGAMQDAPLAHRVVYEADAAHWVRHPAAAKVERYGETPSRRLYVAVERPAGRTLAEVLAVRGALNPPTLVRLAYRLIEALDEAHALGLVHGHLAPDAVVVADALDVADVPGTPLVTLTGLGVATVLHGGVAPSTADPATPYTSPEQLAGAEPDVRSDVFGLASLLYHALTGSPPSPERTDGPPAGAAAYARAVGVLEAARSPDPAWRHPSVKALWDDFLAALVASEPSGELGTGLTTPSSVGTPAQSPAQVPARLAPARRRRRVWEPVAAAAGLVVVGLSLAHGAVLRAGTPSAVTAAPRPAAAHGAAAHATATTVPEAAPTAPIVTTTAGATGGQVSARAHDGRVADAPARASSAREPSHASASQAGQSAEGETQSTAEQPSRAAGPAAQPINIPSFIIVDMGRGRTPAASPVRPDEFKRELSGGSH